MSYKLFIPGPVEVSEKTYKAMATPIMGHRSKDFVKLVEDVILRWIWGVWPQTALLHRRPGFPQHELLLGRDGGRRPQRRQKGRAQLLQRRVFRQVV